MTEGEHEGQNRDQPSEDDESPRTIGSGRQSREAPTAKYPYTRSAEESPRDVADPHRAVRVTSEELR